MKNKKPLLDDLIEPKAGSEALIKYQWAKSCDLQLFHLVVDTVLSSDYAVHIAEHALAGTNDNKFANPSELASNRPGKRTKALRRSSQELLEMFISRIVDNFQIYLVDILREVLILKPEILSARKQELTVAHILKFESVEELIKDIIETKITSLSYDGFGEIQEWCLEKGIPIVIPEGFKSDIISLIALRNIIVHNRGLIDFRYLKTTNDAKSKIGEKFKLDVDYFFYSMKLLDAVVIMTDESIVKKFKIATKNIASEIHLMSKIMKE